jgi:hypothetical protein
MNRQTLCEKCGMLFIFDEQKPLSFWMKNTKIPLDIVFMDKDGKIVQIHQNTTPYQTTPVYNSVSPSQYVLETNAFYTKNNNISTGDIIDINLLISNGKSYQILDK